MQVCTGKNATVRKEVNQGDKIVKDLVKKIENSAKISLAMDVFTSVPLARELLPKKLFRKTNPSFLSNSLLVKIVTKHPPFRISKRYNGHK